MVREKFALYRKHLALATALFISIFLAVAAYGKFFYPAEKLKMLDRGTSIVEVLLIGMLFLFRLHYRLWLILCLLFASWGGYALYWLCLKLPCACAGSLIAFPPTYAFVLDILFFLLSGTWGWVLKASRSALYLTLIASFLSVFIGYIFADWVFTHEILGMHWSLRKY